MFEVITTSKIPQGASGGLVLSKSGKVLGMLVASVNSSTMHKTTLLAIPLRLILKRLKIEPYKKLNDKNIVSISITKPSSKTIGIIPTDDKILKKIFSIYKNFKTFSKNNRRYFQYTTGGGIKIITSPAPEKGNINSAIATTNLINNFDLDILFSVGICAGVDHKTQSIADVIVSSDVIYYETGLLNNDKYSQRVKISGKTSKSIVEAATCLQFKYKMSPKTTFKLHIGPITSGEKVLVGPISFKKIISNFSDIQAVDMESSGIFQAVAASDQKISTASIRGIGSFADSNKVSTISEEPIANITRVTFDLIDSLFPHRL